MSVSYLRIAIGPQKWHTIEIQGLLPSCGAQAGGMWYTAKVSAANTYATSCCPDSPHAPLRLHTPATSTFEPSPRQRLHPRPPARVQPALSRPALTSSTSKYRA